MTSKINTGLPFTHSLTHSLTRATVL